ncbi:SDR family NAD(P)-dependent oxidoreductase [Sphingobium sp. BYY-5]|uniref:SDR family NAD(P)-dependent oxidoreductase n=1 Tax=Sphingobium sp. BYY-5 TaxID=2926400 RepID=UPI001FA6EC9A|nr:SDR family NAD(P)-dependent oxidoreductase [Sphingobium sp. BYY-5]MCI4591002.1 SDR family NAD(P)-dependent oxidoreductase [Sphingobium sp. BYY-5]
MPHMLILGMGYTASRLATRLRAEGWRITGVRRAADAETFAFDDDSAVRVAIVQATHILSSVPPEGEVDPVLTRYGPAIGAAHAIWTGYLSSTGVYGNAAGAWVDESSPMRLGHRVARAQADADWGALRPDIRRFRLPGIYGPGRSALDRVREGRAHRIDLPDQVFSRAHIDDIVAGIVAALRRGPPGIYNLSDDLPCAQNRLIEEACAILGQPLPPLLSLEEAQLSPMARSFYAENRRVANGRAKRLLGWSPRYPTYREGLRACF